MENSKERAAAARELFAKLQRKALYRLEKDDVTDLVTDLLQLDIDYTEKHESYATTSIREMKIAQNRVRDLHMLFEEE